MVLRLESLAKTYPSDGQVIHALRDLSLEIDAGQFCALRGRSGCGKSTLLLTAGGLLRPDRGRVVIQGQDIYAMRPNARAGFRAANIGFVFQQFHLVPYLSVLENVLTATLGTQHGDVREERDRALSLLERFGMQGRITHRPGQLSTGERQRTALARALLNQPQLLLADEPTGNLDEENSEIVLQYIAQFAQEGGGVLLVTHDDRATQFATQRWNMTDGRLVEAKGAMPGTAPTGQ